MYRNLIVIYYIIPSGEKATDVTKLVCPSSDLIKVRVSGSQSLMVLSKLADAKISY
jgi:hypothetical protein